MKEASMTMWIFVAAYLVGHARGYCYDSSCRLSGLRCCNDGYCCSQYKYNSQNIYTYSSSVTVGTGVIVGIVIGSITFIGICIKACVFCSSRTNRSNPGMVIPATATTQQNGMQQYPTVQQYPPGAYPSSPAHPPQEYPPPVTYQNLSDVPPPPAKDPNQPDYSAQPPPY